MELTRTELVEVSEPELYEGIFPYHSVSRIPFTGSVYEDVDGVLVRFDPRGLMTRDLRISDTTFRDGQQSRPPYTVDQIRDLFLLLSKLGGPRGLIRQTEFFLYSKKDKQAVEACLGQNCRFPEVTGWIRADEGDLSLVQNLGLKETGILTSCSDYHIFFKLRSNRKAILEKYMAVVEAALEHGIRPRCHLEDVTRADIDGFVLPFVQRLMEVSEKAPEHLKAKVRLCDTMGYGVSFPGVGLPRSVPKLVYKMVHEGGVPSDRIEWHGHNDFHKVHINAVSTWLYGCDVVNATLLGFGERTGNPPLEGAVIEYLAIRGMEEGVDTTVITEIADYFRRELKESIPKGYPFVGEDFNVTRAGIHADGLNRDERIYNIFDTNALLGRPPKVTITDKSGVDGVVHWVNAFLGLRGKAKLGKKDVVKIARWVADQYDQGRTTSISDEELASLVREHQPENYSRRAAML